MCGATQINDRFPISPGHLSGGKLIKQGSNHSFKDVRELFLFFPTFVMNASLFSRKCEISVKMWSGRGVFLICDISVSLYEKIWLRNLFVCFEPLVKTNVTTHSNACVSFTCFIFHLKSMLLMYNYMSQNSSTLRIQPNEFGKMYTPIMQQSPQLRNRLFLTPQKVFFCTLQYLPPQP